MNRHALRRNFNRYHSWLGWLVGVPLLLWTVSGLFMASWPIETIRGTHLRTEPEAIAPIVAKPPILDGRPARSVTLVQQAGAPLWTIDYMDGGKRRADATTGALLPPLTITEARRIAEQSYAGDGRMMSMRRFAADQAPLELRMERPSWQARFSDGSHIYVDADTGTVLATRSQLWRAFDIMWGLHIMDLQGREDTSHPILILFAVLSILGTLLGMVLLPLRHMRAKRRSAIIEGASEPASA